MGIRIHQKNLGIRNVFWERKEEGFGLISKHKEALSPLTPTPTSFDSSHNFENSLAQNGGYERFMRFPL